MAVSVAFVLGAAPAPAAQARRVVDVVVVGSPRSEEAHEYAGERVTDGRADGRTWREGPGWQRYILTVFDDTDVTVVCTFRGSEGQPRRFALEVEGRVIPTRPFASPSAVPVTVEIRVPFSVTRGRTSIGVVLRGVDGPMPGLLELRTVQEHLELW